MSSDNPNPEQAQAKIATALGRLRGDVMPPITSQAAPRLPEQRLPEQRLADQIGNAPLPTASALRAEPTLGSAAGNAPFGQAGTAPANANPAAGNPMSSNPLGNPPLGNPPLGNNPMSSGPAGFGNAAGVTPPSPISAGSLGNNASGTASSYLGSAPAAATSQPDLLAGVDMGPPPLGSDYPRVEEDDGRRKRNRRMVLIAGAVAAIVIVGFWIGTRHSGDVPVIAADSTPEKVKPTDQGGLQVPNQNVQVLENMNGQPKTQGGETVLPPPEQPVAPPAPAAEGTPAANGQATNEAGQGTQQPSGQEAASTAAPAVPAPAVPAPATATGTATTTPAAPAVPAVPAVPNAGSSAMSASPAVPAAPATTSSTATSPTITASAATSPSAPAATPGTAAATAQPAAKSATTTPAAAPSGKLRVQLAAVKTEAAAKATWAKLQKAHPSQLGNLSLMVEKVDKGAEGVFYRVQAGPFADKAAAKSVCTALAAQGQACILAH
ncbi:MAG TPA: SPOR domain-containing protein [Dongiaceae bacterium]|nr:SPOR domain-containing protein [Dongiaceae bacterium]